MYMDIFGFVNGIKKFSNAVDCIEMFRRHELDESVFSRRVDQMVWKAVLSCNGVFRADEEGMKLILDKVFTLGVAV